MLRPRREVTYSGPHSKEVRDAGPKAGQLSPCSSGLGMASISDLGLPAQDMARGRCSRNPRETNGCRDLWLSPPFGRSHTQPRPDLTAPPGWLLIISNETAKPARESAPRPCRNLPHAGTPHLGVPAEPRAQCRRLAGGRAPLLFPRHLPHIYSRSGARWLCLQNIF